MLIPLYIYFIGFSLLMAIISYRRLKPHGLTIFIPFLTLTLLVELVGVYTDHNDISNGWLYNAYVFVQVIFCSFFLRNKGFAGPFKKIITIGIGLFVLTAVIMYSFYAKFSEFNGYLFLVGGLLVVLSGIFFLLAYFNTDDPSNASRLEPVIWITVGLIAYFAVLSIPVALYRYILFYVLKMGGVMLYSVIPRGMSIILYSCFAYSFYRCRRISRK